MKFRYQRHGNGNYDTILGLKFNQICIDLSTHILLNEVLGWCHWIRILRNVCQSFGIIFLHLQFSNSFHGLKLESEKNISQVLFFKQEKCDSIACDENCLCMVCIGKYKLIFHKRCMRKIFKSHKN